MDIFILTATPIIKYWNKNKKAKNETKNNGVKNNSDISNNLSLLFLLPILAFFFLQLYGLQNYIDSMKNILHHLKNMIFIFDSFPNIIESSSELNEYFEYKILVDFFKLLNK